MDWMLIDKFNTKLSGGFNETNQCHNQICVNHFFAIIFNDITIKLEIVMLCCPELEYPGSVSHKLCMI